MKSKGTRISALVVSALGILLHVYLTAFHTMSGALYHYIIPLTNFIPYLLCLVLVKLAARPIIPLCAAIILLLIDLYLFRGYLLTSGTYRFDIIELAFIVLKLVVALPVGCLIGFLIAKFFGRSAAEGAE